MLLGHAGKQGTSAEEVGGPPGDEHILFSALWRVVLAALPVAIAAMVSLCRAQDKESYWIATVALQMVRRITTPSAPYALLEHAHLKHCKLLIDIEAGDTSELAAPSCNK